MQTSRFLVTAFLVAIALAGCSGATAKKAEPIELPACPLPTGGTPVEPPLVTAQQVENGTGSLMDFALSSRERFREQAALTTPGQAQYLGCLIRKDESPWRSGSTYLVTLTHDGMVNDQAKDMSLSGRLLKRSIYRGILGA